MNLKLNCFLKTNIISKFGKDQQKAFQKLRYVLSDESIIKVYKLGSEIKLHTNVVYDKIRLWRVIITRLSFS